MSRSLPRRSASLLNREIGDEYVVINTETQTAHALEGETALVWRAAGDGTWPDLPNERVAEIVDSLTTLGLLERANGVTRRSMIKRTALIGAGVGIISIALPEASAAASGISGNPGISLNPTSGPKGKLVTITGTNFIPSGTITSVTVGGFSVTPSNTTISAAGAVNFTITVPSTVSAGSTPSVAVTDNRHNTGTALYSVTTPTLILKNAGGTTVSTGPKQVLTVSGGGYLPGATLTVQFDGGSTLATATADGSGNIPSGVTFTVPSGATIAAHSVTVTDAKANVGTAAYTVAAPTLTLSPSNGPSGTVITLAGSGFGPSSASLTATFDGSAATISAAGTPRTTSGGVINGSPTITVPNSQTVGAHTVTATDAFGNVGTATFRVVEITPSPTSLPRNGGGGAGQTVTISGGGFVPNSVLTATTSGFTSISGGPFTATSTGDVPSGAVCTVKYGNGSGSGTITLTDTSGNTATTASISH